MTCDTENPSFKFTIIDSFIYVDKYVVKANLAPTMDIPEQNSGLVVDVFFLCVANFDYVLK